MITTVQIANYIQGGKMSKLIKWKHMESDFGRMIYNGYLGEARAFVVAQNIFESMRPWTIHILLPNRAGKTLQKDGFLCENAAAEVAEQIAAEWLEKAGLQIKDTPTERDISAS